MLSISDLMVEVGGKPILKGINLDVAAGEVHAIMGPNGSGKSTLANVLVGREGYDVMRGSVTYGDHDLLALTPEERAREGVFLAFQYPVEIPGVTNVYLIKEAVNAQPSARIDVIFLSILGRRPTTGERQIAYQEIRDNFQKYKDDPNKRLAGYGNIIWALFNTREFLFIQ